MMMLRSGRRGPSSANENDKKMSASAEVPASSSRTSSLTTPTDRQSSNSQPSTQRTKKDGYHPEFSSLRIEDCMCSTPTECREIMWRWANINAEDMFPYPILPKHQIKETDTGKHLNGYRQNVTHHFYMLCGICLLHSGHLSAEEMDLCNTGGESLLT